MLSSSGEPGEAPWGCLDALANLLGLSSAASGHYWEVFTESWESLRDFKASPGCHLGAIGRLGGHKYTNLEATWSPKQTQAGDCVLSQKTKQNLCFSEVLGFILGSGVSEN